MEQDAVKKVVLRRVSWLVIAWVIILGLGALAIAAVLNVTSVHGFRRGWQGIPVFLLLAGIAGRVANCKVMLGKDLLTVVGPLRTHRIPKAAIRGVPVDSQGSLDIDLGKESKVWVFAFGGSLVDHYVGSTRKAQQEIKAWLRSSPAGGAPQATAEPQTQWTRCWSADSSLALGLGTVMIGVIWMALTGGF
ncbi:hypothetical protein AB0C52_12490 [Streptomyces sp. NPDC048717]|uniref:hypothetical protein n=1 Tax=Streptomyces sp. NPDC048717 TaxID=3154928 RepID=UPI003432DB7F